MAPMKRSLRNATPRFYFAIALLSPYVRATIFLKETVMSTDPENTLILTLDTGPVTIELRPDLAPGHVTRIKELAREGFYDGIVFHRVIPGFMAQGGDPTGSGMSGSKKPNLQAEFSAEPHVRGVCSMARSSMPNSANSQFFICFDDARFLDKQYTVWGQVTDGMENVDALPKGEPPHTPGKIVTMRVAADVA
jgi:peptidylprolyl isomerase